MDVGYHDGSAERNPSPESIYIQNVNRALQGGPIALALYVYLAGRAEEGRVAVSNRALQEVADASESTVRRKIATLVDMGLIEVLTQGNGRGNLPMYRVNGAVVNTPVKGVRKGVIVNNFTIKGVTEPDKGCHSENNHNKGYHELPPLPPKRVSTTPIKGVNDSVRTPPHPLSSNYRVNTLSTVTTAPSTVTGSTDFRSVDVLMQSPQIRRLMKQHNLTEQLTARALRQVQAKWRKGNPPRTPEKAVSRAASWIRDCEEGGAFDNWRREAPLEMGGVAPL